MCGRGGALCVEGEEPCVGNNKHVDYPHVLVYWVHTLLMKVIIAYTPTLSLPHVHQSLHTQPVVSSVAGVCGQMKV